ncbi:hypothetical protein AB4348_17935 [Vibrio breoganii]
MVVSGIVSYLSTGSRGFLVYSILANLLAYIYDTKKMPTIRVFIIGVIIISSFSILGALRRNADTMDLSSIASSSESHSLSDYQGQMRDEVIFANLDEIGDEFYFKTIAMPVLSIVPRDLIGDLKPIMIDGLVARDIFGRYSVGFPVNISTEVLLNFGYCGLFYASIIIIFTLIFQSWCIRQNLIPIYISFMVLSQTFLSSKLVFSTQLLFIFIFIYYAFIKKENACVE